MFNSPTRIDSWEGEFDEVIAPGAFKRSLNARTPVIQFDHGQHPLIGSLPIASIQRLREDARGLYVQARVFDNWMTEPVRDAIREQAISGMSFRFQVVKADKQPGARKGDPELRTLREVKLFELGPVVFPAYADTSVALRSLQRALPDLNLGTPEPPAVEALVTDPPAQDDPQTHSSTRTINQRRAIARLSLKERS